MIVDIFRIIYYFINIKNKQVYYFINIKNKQVD